MKKLLILFITFFLGTLSVFADEVVYNYDLSDLGNLRGSDNQQIDNIVITSKSNINIEVEFYDPDVEDEIGVRFNGTQYILYNNYISNNNYVINSMVWENVDPGSYILEGLNFYGKKQNWGFGKITLTLSESSLGNGINNGNNINLEEEAVKIKFFKEKDDINIFFKTLGEVYFLIVVLMFLFFMFSKKDYELGI